MKKIALLFSVAVLMLGTVGCKKSRTLNLLEGDWEVTSFTEDGVELMGNSTVFASFNIEFEPYDGSEGDFSWTLVENGGGGTTVITGEYEINEAADELEFRFETGPIWSGAIAEMDFMVDKTSLSLEGNIEGFRYEIEADRD